MTSPITCRLLQMACFKTLILPSSMTTTSANPTGSQKASPKGKNNSVSDGGGTKNTKKEDRSILIINLGGGSLDVALITVQEQLFEVKAMHGDTTLGGIDVVRRLMDYCLHDFGEKQSSQVFQNVFALE